MKLNYDCIRDILLCVEENTSLRTSCYFVDKSLEAAACLSDDDFPPMPDYQTPLLERYGNDIFIYHVHYCINANLLIGIEGLAGYSIAIADLSPGGHELIGKLRNSDHWAKTKSILSVLGLGGLKIVSAVSEGVADALIARLIKETTFPSA